jgi:MscS family membrane protein
MEQNLVDLKHSFQTLEKYLFSTDIIIAGIPLSDIILASIILLLTLVLSEFFILIILQKISDLTRHTKSKLDDKFIILLRQPLSWTILLTGLWLVKLVIADNIPELFLHLIDNFFEFGLIGVVAYILFNAAPLLGQFLRSLAFGTQTEIDDLLAPYIPRFFRIAAILLVVVKGNEVFLGTSAGALVGLLGGAGVAIGLLLKDIIYDTFCTILIFADKLYKPDDLLKIDGMEDQVKVIEIGLRSTSVYIIKSESIRKIPNSKMISGIVENFSQKLSNHASSLL